MERLMRAKMSVTDVEKSENHETVKFMAVCSDETFGENGESENNTFSRWTPAADLSMIVTNPNLFGKLKEGDEYYVDFTPTKQ
jgi:hypothetical protein